MREDVLRKLQKLQAMMNRGTVNEAMNANRIYEAMIKKYDISETDLETREKRAIECSADMKKYIVHVCSFLGIDVYTYTHRKNSPLLVESTPSEIHLVNDISRIISAMLKDQKKQAKLQVESYMAGFIGASYPLDDKNPECPQCESITNYSETDQRYYCEKCGWIGKKLRIRNLDGTSYMRGKKESGTMIESRV